MITVIISALTIICIISIYLGWNLLKKIEKQEEIIENQDKYLNSVFQLARKSQEHWEEIDSIGAYKSDDEVGQFYEYLENFQKIVKEYIIEQNERRIN